ncbi:MAG: histidine--tRNA ligase [Firmicutes bacterium HGW-Firmicutes-7]|nr:MAG: histidine--tRNA ligase [Firmicutes bacterium HGW-Firmicutes-7]
MLTQAPRGTTDIFGDYMTAWQMLEGTMRGLCKDFSFNEIRTPIFEHTELFSRGVGETTDIVQKEMYTFMDKGDRSISLKPEGTAGVVRAYLERNLYADTQPTKLFYLTPTFRYEKPQAGRMRQFHQFGVELFGSDHATADAEVIALAAQMLERLNIKNVELNINSLGGPECREKYNALLKVFLTNNKDGLCSTCKDRLEKNPLRILDCKNESCNTIIQDAPLMLDHLGDDCKAHFEELLALLDAMEIKYSVNPWIVRGLDYYTKTVFEFISKEIGAQGTVCGGGRYNGLIEECGGSPTPAVGFGAGIERLLMTIEASNGKIQYEKSVDLYIGTMGAAATRKAASLVNTLRKNNINAEMDLIGRSVKAQMKYANKIGARYSIILGENELSENKGLLKNMQDSEQIEISLDEIINFMSSKKNI